MNDSLIEKEGTRMNSMPVPASERKALVIGAAGLDMVGRLHAPLQQAGSNPANIRVSFGGVARNVAENLARLGQPVELITAVGSDQLGQQLLAHTAGCGVDVSNCVRVENQSTSSYLAVYGPDGELQTALDDMRVLAAMTPAVIRQFAAQIAGADMLFVDANLHPATLKMIFQLAQKAGVPVCADTTSRILAERLEPFLEQLYMLTANRSEVPVINRDTPEVTGRFTALQAVRQLINRGVEIAFIPLAEYGVCYATSETSGYVPAVRTHIVDPTGAGDALTATIIFGLLNDIPIDETVRLGVTAASLILRFPGTVFPQLSLERLYDELVI
jgi:pseudouridine kinase